MAELAAVCDVVPVPRRPEDIIRRPGKKARDRPAPGPRRRESG